jgi:hypothetical protein
VVVCLEVIAHRGIDSGPIAVEMLVQLGAMGGVPELNKTACIALNDTNPGRGRRGIADHGEARCNDLMAEINNLCKGS